MAHSSEHHDLLLALLAQLRDGRPRRRADLTTALGNAEGLDGALASLRSLGLLHSPQRGLYQLHLAPAEALPPARENRSPREQLESAYRFVRDSSYSEILDSIDRISPYAFERLVVQLLQLMGYGRGRVSQRSRDGGIDGEIRGDVLGFERIYLQAKRYDRRATIGRPDVQAFVGALSATNMKKGVFISTANFSREARDYAQNLQSHALVLINGLQLAEYIYDYNLGMQPERQLALKRLDSDYWAGLED